MPKHHAHGDTVKRVRQMLATCGINAEVRLVPKPLYPNYMPTEIVEVLRTEPDGRTHIRHHAAGPSLTEAILDWIRQREQYAPGPTLDEIGRHTKRRDACLDMMEMGALLAAPRFGNQGDVLHIPVRLLDVTQREHRSVHLEAYGPGYSTNYWETLRLRQEVEIELDGKRRARGSAKTIKLSGTLALILAGRGDRRTALGRVLADLRKAIDRTAGNRDDHSAITITGVATIADGLPIRATSEGIRLDGMKIGVGTIRGDRFTVPEAFPETMLAAMAGRRLGDVVEGCKELSDLMVKVATSRKGSTTLRLAAKVVDANVWASQNGPASNRTATERRP